LLYLSARFDLPFSGFYVGADISTLSVDDSSVDDTTLKLGYESKIGFGIEGGIKTFSVELDDAWNTTAPSSTASSTFKPNTGATDLPSQGSNRSLPPGRHPERSVATVRLTFRQLIAPTP
jgi:hypothetical protein